MQDPLSGTQVMAAVASAGLAPIAADVAQQLADYGNLLLRWNARTNLTAIRTPEGVLRRHLVECVAAAQLLPAGIVTLLDYGSGAGLPGIPIALVRPEIAVTLAESQSRKVAFLREAQRTLGLTVEVHAGRVGDLPADRRYDCITLRAVDGMAAAVREAAGRMRERGLLAIFATEVSELVWRELLGDAELRRHALPAAGYLVLLQV